MHRLCFVTSVAGLVIMASAPARAQEPDTLTPAQRAGLALARLGGDQLVCIHAHRVGFVQGRVVSNSANVLTLDIGESRIEVLAADVDSLWVRGAAAREPAR